MGNRKNRVTRRQFLAGATLAAATGSAAVFGSPPSALTGTVIGNKSEQGRGTLVVVFLRGAADGLSMVPPHGEDAYYRLRPTLALPRPNEKRESPSARSLDLDGFFGLHPALAPLLPIYQKGEMAIVHAVGSDDNTRSHFEAMAQMERGVALGDATASGWLARHLGTMETDNVSPLRAIAVSETMPDSLRGSQSAVSLRTLSDFRLNAPEPIRNAAMLSSLNSLYSGEKSSLHHAGAETLKALDAIRALKPETYLPSPGVEYKDTDLGNGLRQVACLMKGRVGMEVACLEMTGWDTHVAQGRDTGYMSLRLRELSEGTAAFYSDLGAQRKDVTVLVMTEFGRRAYENYGLGTDHGRASAMFVLGGGVKGGKVYGDWPTLAQDKMEGSGDLRVTTDYRDVLAEILQARLCNERVAEVFPGWKGKTLGLINPAA